ncbi:YitT family protein [Pseudooceanicola sp. CBS1P-1]|uniref:YitT family protein n=1 Tax=Pseudooceanicola albus TaxID=2692189 RepID=A0A6L7G9L0_9RHOB|nr:MULTISPECIES: YitT family protein [Pseudooceanicola]MBT9384291.1 YitT family protein [Pseudooceanicola endophyticus]MXN20884.1 YitT family protein [Pseudooceanicola albus]
MPNFRSPISLYDAQGLAFGILLTSLGVSFLKACGLVTGQTAGLSVLLSYLLPLNFGVLFLLVSLPFFWLSWVRRGATFTLRTMVAVIGIAVLTPLLSRTITYDHLPPLLAAILAGSCCGVGLIALFRHNASAGGLGILALVIEERTGFKTGWFQMCFDAVIFLLALIFLPLGAVIYSFIGAVVLNAVIAWNFRIHQVQGKAAAEAA